MSEKKEESKDTDIEKSEDLKENTEQSIAEKSLENQFKELNDKYLRLLAENQNLRKNHEQEKEDEDIDEVEDEDDENYEDDDYENDDDFS